MRGGFLTTGLIVAPLGDWLLVVGEPLYAEQRLTPTHPPRRAPLRGRHDFVLAGSPSIGRRCLARSDRGSGLLWNLQVRPLGLSGEEATECPNHLCFGAG